MCYWTVKLCFVLPIKWLINFINDKKQEEATTEPIPSTDTQQETK